MKLSWTPPVCHLLRQLKHNMALTALNHTRTDLHTILGPNENLSPRYVTSRAGTQLHDLRYEFPKTTRPYLQSQLRGGGDYGWATRLVGLGTLRIRQ